MYNIVCRYQYWGPDGVAWTRWYIYEGGIKDKTAGEERLNELVKVSEKDKLKQEYNLIDDKELKKMKL